MEGALNWAILLRFDDDIQWIFRSPKTKYALNNDTAYQLLASEAATLKYIREKTHIPVPEIYSYCATSENEIGIPYILMSKATGHHLSTYDWQTHDLSYPSRVNSRGPGRLLKLNEKQKIMSQLGNYLSQLSRLRFNTIGSLFEEEGARFGIRECLSPSFVLQGRESIKNVPRGPFQNEEDYYLSLVSVLLAHSEQLEMGHHVLFAPVPCPQEYSNFAKYYIAQQRWNDYIAVGDKAESSQNRLHYSIIGMFIRDQVIPYLTRRDDAQKSGFPLCHHDLSTQNIFVDDEFNITCIIDWAFCSTVPNSQLLSTPGLPHPRDLLADQALIGAFRSAFEEECSRFQSIRPSKQDWKTGDMLSYLIRLVNFDALQDFYHLEALYQLTTGAAKDANLRATLVSISTESEARLLSAALAEDDEPENKARLLENKYFSAVGEERRGLARYISFISQFNPLFVADKRLWRWIDETGRSPTTEIILPGNLNGHKSAQPDSLKRSIR
ncbi:Aminoglycoside phosphotransferase [Metarhizium rileyi]|uniref:Aminoglycoside phosphotransferase n=1 Tax=Metarhizium rileyi (strain RCEF 4871) TaxID=1649241 RepID=A0A167HZS0_METRR|nr:Aminoglycoside phosphotransferase [Metarhizium rileyi RCEF 4871]